MMIGPAKSPTAQPVEKSVINMNNLGWESSHIYSISSLIVVFKKESSAALNNIGTNSLRKKNLYQTWIFNYRRKLFPKYPKTMEFADVAISSFPGNCVYTNMPKASRCSSSCFLQWMECTSPKLIGNSCSQLKAAREWERTLTSANSIWKMSIKVGLIVSVLHHLCWSNSK